MPSGNVPYAQSPEIAPPKRWFVALRYINCQKKTNHMQNVVEEYFQPYVTCSWWDMRR
jgi:hypothetical protein